MRKAGCQFLKEMQTLRFSELTHLQLPYCALQNSFPRLDLSTISIIYDNELACHPHWPKIDYREISKGGIASAPRAARAKLYLHLPTPNPLFLYPKMILFFSCSMGITRVYIFLGRDGSVPVSDVGDTLTGVVGAASIFAVLVFSL